MSGTAEVIVAGGVQNMSAIPISAAMFAGREYGFDSPFVGAQGWDHRYGTGEVSQFHGAQLIADKWNITREEMDAGPLRSHERARDAIKNGRFDRKSCRSVSSGSTSARARPRSRKWRRCPCSPRAPP